MATPYQPTVAVNFSCQACGNSFPSSKEQLMQQPVCPKCRTYGRILGPDGRPLALARKATGPSPKALAMGAGHAPEKEVVEVDYSVAHGKQDKTAILRMIFVIAGGAAVLVFVFILVGQLQSNSAARKKTEREEVMDIKAYDAAIDQAIGRVRIALKAGGKCEFVESSNLSEALSAIAAQPTGGGQPAWSSPPKPGAPHRSYSFIVTHTDARGVKHVGFLVLIYYKKAEEVIVAETQLRTQVPTNPHYGLSIQSAMWFAGYRGANFLGPVTDALNVAMGAALPNDFKQFRHRTGQEGDDY